MASCVAASASGGGAMSVSMFSRRRISGSWAASAEPPVRSTAIAWISLRRETVMIVSPVGAGDTHYLQYRRGCRKPRFQLIDDSAGFRRTEIGVRVSGGVGID